jgi:hypothetical protein
MLKQRSRRTAISHASHALALLISSHSIGRMDMKPTPARLRALAPGSLS